MNPPANTVTVSCDNPDCPQHNRPRNVAWIHLGQDVYLTGPLRCGACAAAAELRHLEE